MSSPFIDDFSNLIAGWSKADRNRINSTAVTKSATPVQDKVYQQLLDNYPPKSIAWVKSAEWAGPMNVPFSRIDDDAVKTWAASSEPARVKHFKDKIEAGDHVNPAVSVQEPGEGNVKVIDGHHRALAYKQLGLPVRTYLGKVGSNGGVWDETHSSQFHQSDDPANKHYNPLEARGAHGEWGYGTAEAAVPSDPDKLLGPGLPEHPAEKYMTAARGMVADDRLDSAQKEDVATIIAGNLQHVNDDVLLKKMSERWKVRAVPYKSMDGGDTLGITGGWGNDAGNKPPWEIHFDEDLVKNPARENNKFTQAEQEGWFTTGSRGPEKALQGVLTHEFGHSVMDEILISAMANGQNEKVGQGLEKAIESKIGTYGAINHVSKYGRSSLPELIAESYAADTLGGTGPDGSPNMAQAGAELTEFARRYSGDTLAAVARMTHKSGDGTSALLSIVPCDGFPASVDVLRRRYGDEPDFSWFTALVQELEDDDSANKHFNPLESRGHHGEWESGSGEAEQVSDTITLPKDFQKRLGLCYQLSGQYVMSHSGSSLVHGSIQGFGNPRIGHAWVITKAGNIWEPATNAIYSKQLFNGFFNAQENVVYSSTDAMSQMAETGTFGPWDKASLVLSTPA